MHTYVQCPKRLEMSDSLRLGVQKGVSDLWGVVGTELRSSVEQQGLLSADPSVQLPLDNFLQNCGYGQKLPYKAHWRCVDGNSGSRRQVLRVKVESSSGDPQESFTIMDTRADAASAPHQQAPNHAATPVPNTSLETRKSNFQMPTPLGLWYFVIENCNEKRSRINTNKQLSNFTWNPNVSFLGALRRLLFINVYICTNLWKTVMLTNKEGYTVSAMASRTRTQFSFHIILGSQKSFSGWPRFLIKQWRILECSPLSFAVGLWSLCLLRAILKSLHVCYGTQYLLRSNA